MTADPATSVVRRTASLWGYWDHPSEKRVIFDPATAKRARRSAGWWMDTPFSLSIYLPGAVLATAACIGIFLVEHELGVPARWGMHVPLVALLGVMYATSHWASQRYQTRTITSPRHLQLVDELTAQLQMRDEVPERALHQAIWDAAVSESAAKSQLRSAGELVHELDHHAQLTASTTNLQRLAEDAAEENAARTAALAELRARHGQAW